MLIFKKVCSLFLTVLMIVISLPFSTFLHASVKVQSSMKQLIVYNGGKTSDSSYIDVDSENTSTFVLAWGQTWRNVALDNSITYVIDLPDNCINAAFNAYGFANGRVDVSSDKETWYATDYDSLDLIYTPFNQNFLVNNPSKMIYVRVFAADSSEGGYSFGSFVVNYITGFKQEQSSTTQPMLSKKVIVGTSDEFIRLYSYSSDGDAGYSSDSSGISQRNIWGGGNLVYCFDLPNNTTNFTINSFCWGNVKFAVSKDAVNWMDKFVMASTPQGNNIIAGGDNSGILTNNDEKTVFIKVYTGGALAMRDIQINYFMDLSKDAGDTVNADEIYDPLQAISFTPNSTFETDYLYHITNDTGAGQGFRFSTNDDYFTYKFDLPDNTTVANIALAMSDEYSVFVSSDNVNYERIARAYTKDVNGINKTTRKLRLSRFLQNNENKTLYIKLADPTIDDGWGTILSKLTLTYFADGRVPDAVDLEKDPLLVLPPVGSQTTIDIGFAPNSINEMDYLQSDSGTIPGDFFGNPMRGIIGENTLVYKFKVDTTAKDVKLNVSAGNLYKFEASKDGIKWTKILAEANGIKDLTNYGAYNADLSGFLTDNPTREVYIRVSSSDPKNKEIGCFLLYIGILETITYDGTNIVIPSDADTTEKIFAAKNTDFDITVKTTSVSLPIGVNQLRLGADTVEGGSVFDSIYSNIYMKNRSFSLYYITIYDQRQKEITLNSNGIVNVKMAIPAQLLTGDYDLFYYNISKNTLEKINMGSANGYYSFDATEFGYFVFAKSGKTANNPNTGDTDILGYVLAIVICSSFFVALNIKKKKNIFWR